MNLVPAFVRRRLAHRPNLVKILDNIGWLFLDKVLRMGVGLLVGVWIARYLGPEQFGLLNFALAFTGLFAAISGMGLQGIVVRDIVRDPQSAPLTLGTAAVLMLIGGFVSYLLILAAIAYLRPDDPLARTIVAILGAIQLFKASEIAVYWFESQVQSKYTVWVQNGVFLVFAVVKVGLILSQASLTAFVWATLAEAAVVAVILLLVLRWHGMDFQSFRISIDRAKHLIAYGWPLALSSIVLMIQARVDQLMLGQLVGEVEVGYYSAALRVAETASSMTMLLYSTFMPVLAESKAKSHAAYQERLIKFYKLNGLVAILATLPFVFCSDLIIRFLYGEMYQGAVAAMALMSFRVFFAYAGVARGVFLVNEGFLRFSAFTVFVSTLVNVCLNYFLIPRYLSAGAAVASAISFFVATFLIDMVWLNTRKNAFRLFVSMVTSFSLLNPAAIKK